MEPTGRREAPPDDRLREIRDGCVKGGGLFPDCASLHPGYVASASDALPLPAADAARLAGPDLNPCIERLGIERTTVSPREFCTRRAARFLRARLRNPGDLDPLGMDDPGPGFRFRASLRALICTIALGFDLHRCKFGRWPKRLRRQHGLRKIQSEGFLATIFGRRGQAAARQPRR